MFENPTGGNDSAVDYGIQFCSLAAQSECNDAAFKAMFQEGVNTHLQAELACWDEDNLTTQYIMLAIHLDNLIRNKPPWAQPLPDQPTKEFQEPMQIGWTHVTLKERQRHLRLQFVLWTGF